MMSKKQKRKVGAPTKYNPDHHVPEMEKLAEFGMAIEDIAVLWGVNKDTIYEWQKKHKEFADAYQKGVANRKMKLRIATLRQAYNGNIGALVLAFKIFEGWRDNAQIDLNAIKPIVQIIEGEISHPGKKQEDGLYVTTTH